MTDAIKHDSGKLRWDLVPYDALEEVVRIYTNGAEKYGERNWERGLSSSRLMSAAMRHLIAWWMGHDRDADQPEHYNLAAAAWNILALLAYHLRGIGADDRPVIRDSRKAEPTDKGYLSVAEDSSVSPTAEDSSVVADEDAPHPCSVLGMTQWRLRQAIQEGDRLAAENAEMRRTIGGWYAKG